MSEPAPDHAALMARLEEVDSAIAALWHFPNRRLTADEATRFGAAVRDALAALRGPEPLNVRPNITEEELHRTCLFLQQHGWSGLTPLDEAVAALRGATPAEVVINPLVEAKRQANEALAVLHRVIKITPPEATETCHWCDLVKEGRRRHCPTHGFTAEATE